MASVQRLLWGNDTRIPELQTAETACTFLWRVFGPKAVSQNGFRFNIRLCRRPAPVCQPPPGLSYTLTLLVHCNSTKPTLETSMTRFRPCIDLHAGSVKQIIGGTLIVYQWRGSEDQLHNGASSSVLCRAVQAARSTRRTCPYARARE